MKRERINMRVLAVKKRRWMEAAASVGMGLSDLIEAGTDELVRKLEREGKITVRKEREVPSARARGK